MTSPRPGPAAREEALPAFLLPGPPPPPEVRRRRHLRLDDAGHVPGEPGLWVFVLGDMSLFAAFFLAFLYSGGRDRATFAASREQLDQFAGGVNTLVLLTSSLLVVLAVQSVRRGWQARAAPLIGWAGLCGLVFVAIKVNEYVSEVAAGNTPTSNEFFTYYFVLTGIHLLHVLVGMVLLVLLWRRLRAGSVRTHGMVFAEGAATYWHMVDLLWIVLFPLLYLGYT